MDVVDLLGLADQATWSPTDTRVLVPAAAAEERSLQRQLRGLVQRGVPVRQLPWVSAPAVVCTEQTAIVSLVGPVQAVLVTTCPRTVALVRESWEAQWLHAHELRGGPSGATHPLNERELLTARMLAEGLTHSAAARMLGVSERSIHRYSESIRCQLGALSSFQAGYRAAVWRILDEVDVATPDRK